MFVCFFRKKKRKVLTSVLHISDSAAGSVVIFQQKLLLNHECFRYLGLMQNKK